MYWASKSEKLHLRVISNPNMFHLGSAFRGIVWLAVEKILSPTLFLRISEVAWLRFVMSVLSSTVCKFAAAIGVSVLGG